MMRLTNNSSKWPPAASSSKGGRDQSFDMTKRAALSWDTQKPTAAAQQQQQRRSGLRRRRQGGQNGQNHQIQVGPDRLGKWGHHTARPTDIHGVPANLANMPS
jgi:hypothetical protein